LNPKIKFFHLKYSFRSPFFHPLDSVAWGNLTSGHPQLRPCYDDYITDDLWSPQVLAVC